MKVLVINGPNLNMLGVREPELYGTRTYEDLENYIREVARTEGMDVDIYQSNHEGALVDKIQEAYGWYDALVINAAAYTHTSIAILDALKAVRLPTVEVHLTDIDEREPFRRISFISLYAERIITGRGFEGYRQALIYLNHVYGQENEKEEDHEG